jgi:hypothetical protein
MNYLNNLEILDLYHNNLKNLDFLTDIPNKSLLKELTLSANLRLNTIEELADFTGLTSLRIGKQYINSYEPLENLTALESINIGSSFKNFEIFFNLPNLQNIIAEEIFANLEQSFAIHYLERKGVSISAASKTEFDLENPVFCFNVDMINIIYGETYDWSNLFMEVYDAQDGYLTDMVTISIEDTSILDVGSHDVIFSVSDSAGNESSYIITVNVKSQ